MATLITGGAGFVGLALAERLIADGDRVVLFDLAAPQALARPELAGMRFVGGDIRSAADIDRALGTEAIDRVVHAAAITPNEQRERTHARDIVDVNIGGTVNLMERIAACGGVARVVALSSVAVYGFSSPHPSDAYEEELSPPAPAALYGITKLAAEQAALRLGHLHGLDVRVARLGPVYGRWEHATGLRDALSPQHQVVQAALEGREVVLPRAMHADWIYAGDVASGLANLCRASALQHRIYHVGGGRMSDLVEWCGLVAARWPSLGWRLASPGEAPSVVYGMTQDRAPLSIARLQRDTGFVPAFDPQAALADYLGWLGHDERGHDLQGQVR